MSLQTALRTAAQRAIRATGGPVTIRRVTPGAYNTTTGTAAAVTEDQDVTGRLDDYTDREMQNTSVHAGDRKLFVAALDLSWEPVEHDRVVLAEAELDIVRVRRHMAGELPAFYTMQVRG